MVTLLIPLSLLLPELLLHLSVSPLVLLMSPVLLAFLFLSWLFISFSYILFLAKYSVAVNIYDSTKRLVSTKTHQYQLAYDYSKYAIGTFPSTLSTYVAGNASVVLTETIVAATPPTPKVPVLSLTYAVTAGWKYLLLTPRASTPITECQLDVACGYMEMDTAIGPV